MKAKGKIAPHEGKELDLVLNGTKLLAVIEKAKQPEVYEHIMQMWRENRYPQLNMHLLLIRPWVNPDLGKEVIVTRHDNIHLIYSYLDAVKLPEGPKKHWVMGWLFGYSEADIQAFIDNPPDCNCSKCKGASQ